jgi:hypothetical protein
MLGVMSTSVSQPRPAPAAILRSRERYPRAVCVGLMALMSSGLWAALIGTLRWLLPWH